MHSRRAMRGWLDRDSWERMCRGDACPLCEAMTLPHDQDRYGVTLLRTESSLVRLSRNQRQRGYCVVVAVKHVVEPFQLPPHEARAFFDDVLAVASAVNQICAPIKVNYEILGNVIPHLHCHVFPRYADDGSPPGPLTLFAEPPVHLPEDEMLALATSLRATMLREMGGDDGELRFEPLRHDQLPALQALCEACSDYFELMTGAHASSTEAQALTHVVPETAKPTDKFVIGVHQGRDLIGALDLYRHYPRPKLAWMGILLLHPKLRGHGHGAAMIRWMIDWAREQGCVRLRLGVADDNARALEVLGRHGFRPTGERISRVSGARRLVLLPLEREL
jgi:diadenosine tetraphosphate (Ap4A) HIT family hydrolase/GNAT superfamily N-acetyltransferase